MESVDINLFLFHHALVAAFGQKFDSLHKIEALLQAGGSVRLRDKERPEGVYYVTGVEIEFGQNGAKRKVTLGRKLG